MNENEWDVFKDPKDNKQTVSDEKKATKEGEVNIFEAVPEPERLNYFKFEKIGDGIQGTYIARNDDSINSYGSPQTLVALKTADGEEITVSIRHSKIGLLKILDQVTFGQIIGFQFTGEKPNPNKNPTKFIRLAHDPEIVDADWIKEQGGKTAATPTKVKVGAPSAANIASTPDAVPSDNEEKIKQVITLAKAKLGAEDEESVKAKIMEKTGLAFINANLDLILERLNAL
jgi:hypothetical protein